MPTYREKILSQIYYNFNQNLILPFEQNLILKTRYYKDNIYANKINSGACFGFCVFLSKFILHSKTQSNLNFMKFKETVQKNQKTSEFVAFWMKEIINLYKITNNINSPFNIIFPNTKYTRQKDTPEKGFYYSSIERNNLNISRPNSNDSISHIFYRKSIEDRILEMEKLKYVFSVLNRSIWKLNKIGVDCYRDYSKLEYNPDLENFITKINDVIEINLYKGISKINFMLIITTEHALSIYYLVERGMHVFYFFDPNYGIYRFESYMNQISDKFIAFISLMLSLYTFNKDGVNYGSKGYNLITSLTFYDFKYQTY